jgi:hypothetical protein
VQRRTRTILIASAAASVAALAYFAPEPPPAAKTSSAVPSASRQGAESAAATVIAPAALPERAAIGRPRGEPFAVRSWVPSAPPSAQRQQKAAAPLAAPPLPYKYAGKLIREGGAELFLSKGDVVFPVVKGETLDGAYRVESIAPDEITLLYIPLGTRERIPVLSALGSDEPIAQASTPGRAAATPSPPRSPGTSAVTAPSDVAAQSTSQPGITPAAAPGADRAQLRWEGPERVRAGSNFDVALRVTSVQPLRASPMQLRFDSELLEPVTVRPGSFYGAGKGNFSYRVNPDGTIFVGVSGRGSGAAADAELLVMTFKPMKAGATAELNVASLNLLGATGRSIAHAQLQSFRTAITR